MKNDKHIKSLKGVRNDDEFLIHKGVKKDRSEKKRLSIYDDFEEDNQLFEDNFNLDSSDNYDN